MPTDAVMRDSWGQSTTGNGAVNGPWTAGEQLRTLSLSVFINKCWSEGRPVCARKMLGAPGANYGRLPERTATGTISTTGTTDAFGMIGFGASGTAAPVTAAPAHAPHHSRPAARIELTRTSSIERQCAPHLTPHLTPHCIARMSNVARGDAPPRGC